MSLPTNMRQTGIYIYNGNSKQIAGEAEITNNIEPKNHIIRATSTN